MAQSLGSKRRAKRHSGMFEKGRKKTGGRAPGTPNRITVEVKEFFRSLVSDPDVQDAFKAQIVMGEKGSMAAFLGAAAHVIGRPKETVAVETTPSMAKLITMSIQAAQEKAAQAKAQAKGKGGQDA